MADLVRDLQEFRIIFYWQDDQGQRLSPEFATLPLAREWFVQHQFAQYGGNERRRSHIDRRRLYERREATVAERPFRSLFPAGRRKTDKTIRVTLDLAKEKLAKLADQYRSDDLPPAQAQN